MTPEALTPPALRGLLRDTLALWEVEARVDLAAGAVLVTVGGTTLGVRPAGAAEHPVRWWLDRPGGARPCTSVLGLLRSLRNAAGGAEARRLLLP